MGINNPLQVKTNPNYQRLLQYWKKNTEKPTVDEAFNGLMQLATDSRIENTIQHREVVDAMFRQVRIATAKPWVQHSVPKTVYAVNYDIGRLGVAYHSTDSANYRVSRGQNIQWNKGWMYRNEGVDIDTCSDQFSNGYQVKKMQPGEWLQYSFTSKQARSHKMELRANSAEPVIIDIMINGTAALENVTINSSGSWTTYPLQAVQLKAGVNEIRVVNKKGELSFNSFRLY
jgi:hypothetical protein